MKEVKKQFKLEEYNQLLTEGKELNKDFRLETRGGNEIKRILCTDGSNENFPIVGYKNDDGYNALNAWKENGSYFMDEEKTNDDLFIVTYEEEKYRPYNTAKEVFEDCIKHKDWVRRFGGTYETIEKIEEEIIDKETIVRICIDDIWFSVNDVVNDYVWADDETPCGVKEE